MPFCSQCGAAHDAGIKFCGSCGNRLDGTPVPGTQYTAQDLTNTTQAVRSYAASASQAEKEKKYGQQKWGLFETNYQRNKGITTDESLQEIEEFAKHGVVSGDIARAPSGGQGGFGSGSGARAGGAHSGGAGGGFGSAGGGAGGASGGGFGSGGAGQGGLKFGPGGDAGAAFFAQHQDKEAAKYKPGYRG